MPSALSKQRGLSGLGLVFTLIVLAMLLLVGFKLFPIYMESLKVDHALSGVIEEPGIAEQSKRDIAFSITRRLDIDGVYRIKESNWQEYFTITRIKDKVTITADWQAETPLIGNLSLVATFHKEVSNRP